MASRLVASMADLMGEMWAASLAILLVALKERMMADQWVGKLVLYLVILLVLC